MSFRFHIAQYLGRRAADWEARGFEETLADWPSLNARSKFWGDDSRAAFKNWEEVDRPAQPARRPAGRRRAHHAARVAAPARHDGDAGEPARRAGAAAHAAAAGEDRRRQRPARRRQQPAAGILLRPECRADRDAGAGRLRDDGLRPGVQAQRRRHALRLRPGRHGRRRCPAPGLPFSPGLPRRARPGGRRAARSPPPTKPPHAGASRRPLFRRFSCRMGGAQRNPSCSPPPSMGFATLHPSYGKNLRRCPTQPMSAPRTPFRRRCRRCWRRSRRSRRWCRRCMSSI